MNISNIFIWEERRWSYCTSFSDSETMVTLQWTEMKFHIWKCGINRHKVTLGNISSWKVKYLQVYIMNLSFCIDIWSS